MIFRCSKCDPTIAIQFDKIRIKSPEPKKTLFDDRMYTSCTLKGKHRCEDLDEVENGAKDTKFSKFKRACHTTASNCQPSTSRCPDRPKLNFNLRENSPCWSYCDIVAGTSSSSCCGRGPSGISEKRNLSPNLEQTIKKSQKSKLNSAANKQVRSLNVTAH